MKNLKSSQDMECIALYAAWNCAPKNRIEEPGRRSHDHNETMLHTMRAVPNIKRQMKITVAAVCARVEKGRGELLRIVQNGGTILVPTTPLSTCLKVGRSLTTSAHPEQDQSWCAELQDTSGGKKLNGRHRHSVHLPYQGIFVVSTFRRGHARC